MVEPWDIFFEAWYELAVGLDEVAPPDEGELPMSLLGARTETLYHLLAERGWRAREADALAERLLGTAIEHLREGREPVTLLAALRAAGREYMGTEVELWGKPRP